MIQIENLSDNLKMYLVCMYFAKMRKDDARYKLRNDMFKVLAARLDKKVPTLKNIKDGYDSCFPDNGREGGKDNRIENNPKTKKILDDYGGYSVNELEPYVNNIYKYFLQEKNKMFISMRLAKPSQAHPVIDGIEEFEMDGINVLKDDLAVGTKVFIVLGGDKGKSEVDWELGLYAIGHVSKEPYDIGYEQGKKSDYFKIMVTVDYKFIRPLSKQELMYYEDSYNATFIGIEIKRSQTQAIGSLEEEKAIAVLRASLDYNLITKEKLEELFSSDIVDAVLGYIKKFIPVNVLYGQDDYSAFLSQYNNKNVDRLTYLKSLSLDELKKEYNVYKEKKGILYPESYNWWTNIWKYADSENQKEYFWNVIEHKSKEEIYQITKSILIKKNVKTGDINDLSNRKSGEVNRFIKFVNNEDVDDNYIDDIDDIDIDFDIDDIDDDLLPDIAEHLNYSYNRIIYGAPGTGKSYQIMQELGEDFAKSGYCRRVTFHPAYTYAQFFGSYKPVSNDGYIAYKYVAGPFLQTMLDAIKQPSRNYVLIIEEINRANVASVFGDAFQLLDRDKEGNSEYDITISSELSSYAKSIGVKLENNKLYIPSNMYIWATMNSADQGVMPLDTAFKRRWEFEYIDINSGEEIIKDYTYANEENQINWNDIRKHINGRMIMAGINEDKCLGPFFISKNVLESCDYSKFISVLKNKVLMYLFEDAAKYEMDYIIDNKYKNDCKTLSGLFSAFDKYGISIFEGYNGDQQ